MQKNFLGLLGLAVLAAPTFAQTTKPMGVSAKVGLFFPTANRAKSQGKQWLGVGAEYKLGDLKVANENDLYSAHYSVSFDYFSKGSFTTFPLLANYVGRLQEGIWYSAGAGLNFTRELSTQGGTTTRESKVGFAYAVGVSYDIKGQSMPMFVEAKYHGSSRSQLNGLILSLGVRF